MLLDNDRYQNTIQCESVKKMRSVFSNVLYALSNTLTTSVLARDVRKTYVTFCSAYSLLSVRLIVGIYKRTGNEVR